MKKVLVIFEKFIHPSKWVLFLAPPIANASLIYIFVTGDENSTLAHSIYVLSAYCFIVLILPLAKLIQDIKSYVMQKIKDTKFGDKYVNDFAFRGSVSIYQGMIINFLYVLFRIFVGIRYASVWFISMAVYYLVLAFIRLFLILNYRNSNKKVELACYQTTAWLLFLLNIPMGGMMIQMVFTNSGYFYPGYVIYLSALYTFYTMATSIINLVRFHKLGNLILSAAKVLNFIAALMSILGLQTAMIAQFSKEGESYRMMMNALTGSVIWLSVILIAVYMLYRSSKLKSEVKFDE